MAKVSGLPGYRFVTVGYPHPPLCTWSDDEIRELARSVVPTVLELLTGPAVADAVAEMTTAGPA